MCRWRPNGKCVTCVHSFSLMPFTIFVAHSKDDGNRFVEPLSIAFKRAEMEVVESAWQLAARDSLIDRIFLEGLKGADAFLLVLSRFTISHDWVRHEVEESVVERITDLTPLIVLVLDDVALPAGISDDVPVFYMESPGDMVELSSLVQELGPILQRRGSGGSSHVGEDEGGLRVPGLTGTESTLLALSCRSAIENDSFLVKAEDVSRLAEPLVLDSESFRLALETLNAAGHVKVKRANGGQVSVMEIQRESFGVYMRQVLEDMNEIVADLATEIIGGVRDNQTLVERFELPPLVVTYLLDDLDAKGQITVIRQMKGNRRIKRLSPEFLQIYG